MALVGMHIAMKELPDWLWATVWWSDLPPGCKEPGPLGPPGTIWSNYRLVVTFSPFPGPGGQVEKLGVTFNPYLEASFLNGKQSNCVACHQMARWSHQDWDLGRQHVDTSRKKLAAGSPELQSSTTVDYIWSLSLRNQQPIDSPTPPLDPPNPVK